MRTHGLRTAIGIVAIFAAAFASIASGETDKPEVIGRDNSSGTTAVAFDPDADSTEGGASGPTDAEDAQELTTEADMTSGLDSIGTRHTSAGALVTNPNGNLAAYDVEVLFNLVSANGTVLDSEGVDVAYIPAFSTVPVASSVTFGFDQAEEPASVEVAVTGGFAEDTGWDGADFLLEDGIDLEVTGAAITAGGSGKELTAQVTNPSDTVAELSFWHCVFKNGGTIVGGDSSTISDRIPPGATVAISSFLSLDLTADEVICRAYA